MPNFLSAKCWNRTAYHSFSTCIPLSWISFEQLHKLDLVIYFFVYLHWFVNLTVQDLLRQDGRIQNLYFNISEMNLSITSLFSVQLMSYLGTSDIIYSDGIDSFISEIFEYKFWILAFWCKRSLTVRFTTLGKILKRI